MDARIEEVVLALMEPWRKGAGQFVADVVRGWESRTVVDRVELAVGRDLHYIRVNGTVVGAVVGCIIFLLSAILLCCRPIAPCHEIRPPHPRPRKATLFNR